MVTNTNKLDLIISHVTCEAKDVVVLELEGRTGAELPEFAPGAHLELYLPNGLIRHYSLCSSSAERKRYRIAVGLARTSRGGSRFIHQSIKAGAAISVSHPRNNFPLVDAEAYCFIAGGIGITPIISMIYWCVANDKRWRLYYCARNRQRAAFYEELQLLSPNAVNYHFDDEQPGRLFDIATILQEVSADAHLYCCGPAPLMEAVRTATRSHPENNVHFEWFSAPAKEEVEAGIGFAVTIHSTGDRFEVPPEKSILEVLEEHGFEVPFACRGGFCGTCQTRVIAGQPEHRDSVLSKAERALNNTMMICVSRARSGTIELDI